MRVACLLHAHLLERLQYGFVHGAEADLFLGGSVEKLK
jgi:hypothetical protein